MATIVTRAGKGSPLTNVEVDANFTNLNNELGTKQATLVSTSNIKSINGQSILGSGDLVLDVGVTTFNTRTGSIALLSADVTTALGFTPYNSTNPNAYIDTNGTARTIVENNGTLIGARRALNFIPGTGISLSITDDAANEEVDVTITSTVTGGVTSFNTRTGAVTLSSGDVTTALGFTPYNSTNPSGYITSSGSITGNAATATSVTGVAGVLGYTTSAQNTAAASGIGPQVTAQGGGGAVLSFHRPGAYGLNMGLDSDNVFRIGGWSASANRLQMDMTGNLTMNGNVTAYSDERLKTDWADLPDDFVDRLASVKHGTYTRIDSGERQAGSSAQDWQRLLPEVVSEGEHLSLAYGNAALVSAIKLAQRVVYLEQRLESLLAATNTQR